MAKNAPVKKKHVYSVIIYAGSGQALVKTESIKQARQWAKEEYGRLGDARVTLATKADIAWVKGLGGAVHEE